VSAAIAMAAMRPDAALRLQLQQEAEIHVIHASDDPIFCPCPERWNNLPGVHSYTLPDTHIFKNAASKRALAELVTALYRFQTRGEEP
jgi:hypothetical protein